MIPIRIITVKIPEAYLEGLEELVNTGRYTSRSEAIRAAIRDLLKRELWDISSNASNDQERFDEGEAVKKQERSGKIIKVTI